MSNRFKIMKNLCIYNTGLIFFNFFDLLLLVSIYFLKTLNFLRTIYFLIVN